LRRIADLSHGLALAIAARLDAVRSLCAVAAILVILPAAAWAGPLDDIGYTRLRNELGAALPSGSMTPVAQSEAEVGASGSNQFYPDKTLAAFTGKTFTDVSGSHLTSGHATSVAANFYGNTDSPAQGIDEIRLYTATGWLGSDYLRTNNPGSPLFTTARVANHSWIHQNSPANAGQTNNTLQRMDFLVETDDFIQVAGVNNRDPGETDDPFDIFGGGMNIIAVGSTFGTHSTGTNPGLQAPYIVGRTRPHLVAPGSVATSFTAPLVAGAAAMLVDTAHARPAISNGSVSSSVGRANLTLQNGETSEVIRALLLAGADRHAAFGFGTPETWAINTADGLNSKYGAGELDIYNSYRMLTAGEHNSREAGSTKDIDMYGWDYDPAFVSNTTRTYRFEIEEGTRQFAASLTWNLDINLGSNPTLRNLNLRLRNVATDATIQQSAGTIDVMENLYVPTLGPGQYELIVSGMAVVPFTTEYGLAWRFATSTPPIPGDVNLDGSVNLMDLSILQKNFGQSNRIIWTDGDMNGDGTVNRSDLLALVNNFGVGGTIAVGADLDEALKLAGFAPAAVPEPSTAWAAVLFAFFIRRACRFRSPRGTC
jgi:hypothetical protein